MNLPENESTIVSSPLKMTFNVMVIISFIANVLFCLVFIPFLNQVWGMRHGKKLVLESGADSR